MDIWVMAWSYHGSAELHQIPATFDANVKDLLATVIDEVGDPSKNVVFTKIEQHYGQPKEGANG